MCNMQGDLKENREMSGFELIAQELVKQQQHMQMLDAENRELRRQLADLRAGYGIFIEIAGQRFSLAGEILPPQSATISTEEDLPMPRTTASLQEIPVVNAHEAIDTLDEEEEEPIPVVESVSAEATPVEIASSLEEEESGKRHQPSWKRSCSTNLPLPRPVP